MAFKLLPWYGRVRDWHRMVQFCEDHMNWRLKVCFAPQTLAASVKAPASDGQYSMVRRMASWIWPHFSSRNMRVLPGLGTNSPGISISVARRRPLLSQEGQSPSTRSA
jgi:hypothetical protein